MQITTVNPATGVAIDQYETLNGPALEHALALGAKAAEQWKTTPISERIEFVERLAGTLIASRESLARLATLEMGKPISESRAEVDRCVDACHYFAANLPKYLREETASTADGNAFVAWRPLGLILLITPWNFPFWQVIRSLVPAIIGGNAVLFKPADNTTGSGIALANAILQADIPEGLVTMLTITPEIVHRVIADQRVSAVALTGSSAAGRAVAASAGNALKKTVLELGGSDPFIVLCDADLEAAATSVVASRFRNAGQSCIAAKRLIVEEGVAEDLLSYVVAHVKELRVGDPFEEDTDIGPLARVDLRDRLRRQVSAAVNAGGNLLVGGQAPDRPGAWFEPAVVDTIPRGQPMLTEEVFGPALAVVRVRDTAAAVNEANNSRFGLGATLWTSDENTGKKLASQLAAGIVTLNGMTRSRFSLPFGGVKESGYGRELSYFGLREFLSSQSIVVDASLALASR